MKVVVDREEWWPVYEIVNHGSGYEIDLPEEKIKWIEEVVSLFRETQDYLREAYKNGSRRRLC